MHATPAPSKPDLGDIATTLTAGAMIGVSSVVRGVRGNETQSSAEDDVEVAIDSALTTTGAAAAAVVATNILAMTAKAAVTVATGAIVGPALKLFGVAGAAAVALEEDTANVTSALKDSPYYVLGALQMANDVLQVQDRSANVAKVSLSGSPSKSPFGVASPMPLARDGAPAVPPPTDRQRCAQWPGRLVVRAGVLCLSATILPPLLPPPIRSALQAQLPAPLLASLTWLRSFLSLPVIFIKLGLIKALLACISATRLVVAG